MICLGALKSMSLAQYIAVHNYYFICNISWFVLLGIFFLVPVESYNSLLGQSSSQQSRSAGLRHEPERKSERVLGGVGLDGMGHFTE